MASLGFEVSFGSFGLKETSWVDSTGSIGFKEIFGVLLRDLELEEVSLVDSLASLGFKVSFGSFGLKETSWVDSTGSIGFKEIFGVLLRDFELEEVS
jgi:hypothetical protein